jgi:hypothetical protein
MRRVCVRVLGSSKLSNKVLGKQAGPPDALNIYRCVLCCVYVCVCVCISSRLCTELVVKQAGPPDALKIYRCVVMREALRPQAKKKIFLQKKYISLSDIQKNYLSLPIPSDPRH